MRIIHSLKRFCLIAWIALVAVMLNPIMASATSFTTVQLTNNSYDDWYPQVSGNSVVWHGSGAQIFYYNGSSTVRLSDRGHNGRNPKVSGNNVAWFGRDGHDWEIFYYNGSITTQLTNNSGDDERPKVSGNNVVWRGHDGHDWEIFYYNGSITTQLTNNSYDDLAPEVSGNHVVWRGYDGHDREIFLYDGSSIVQLTNNDFNDLDPKMSGTNIVWGAHGDDWEIFFYNGSGPILLTDGHRTGWRPQISGTNVVWEGRGGGRDTEIFFYDGSSTIKLTDNTHDEWNPQVSGSNVVWSASDGNDSEVFFYDGSSIMKLTNNRYADQDPQVSGDNIVWRGQVDGLGTDYEIFSAKPKPSVSLWTPNVSTKHSKRPEFTVRWKGLDSQKGVDTYTVKVRRDDRRTWHTLLSETKDTSYLFKGKMGHTYSFRVSTKDDAGDTKWSRVKKTIVPYNEGANVYKRLGFNGYFKGFKSSYYLSSTRYSYKKGHTASYKIPSAKSIGLITTKGPKRGKAKIYIDGKWVKTVDAYSSKNRPRQLIYNKTFKTKKTHYIKIVNLGTPGRARFDIDGIAVGR